MLCRCASALVVCERWRRRAKSARAGSIRRGQCPAGTLASALLAIIADTVSARNTRRSVTCVHERSLAPTVSRSDPTGHLCHLAWSDDRFHWRHDRPVRTTGAKRGSRALLTLALLLIVIVRRNDIPGDRCCAVAQHTGRSHRLDEARETAGKSACP